MSSRSWLVGVAMGVCLGFFLGESRAQAQLGGPGIGGARANPNPGIGGGGVGIIGGSAGGGVGAIGGSVGGGAIGFGGMRAAPVRPAVPSVRLPSPSTTTAKPAVVDKEMIFAVASDATFTKLQASAAGLNYVSARFEDIQVGQRLSVNPLKKDDEKKGDDLTGTVLAVNAAERQVTLKVGVPAEQADEETKTQPAQVVTIRSSGAKK